MTKAFFFTDKSSNNTFKSCNKRNNKGSHTKPYIYHKNENRKMRGKKK